MDNSEKRVESMVIDGIQIDMDKLISTDELMECLKEHGETDCALSYIRDRYQNQFDNELIWRYPISDGWHMGTYIVCTKEGFISIPYDEISKDEYEILLLDDAVMLDEDVLKCFIDQWKVYSDILLGAMTDILRTISI